MAALRGLWIRHSCDSARDGSGPPTQDVMDGPTSGYFILTVGAAGLSVSADAPIGPILFEEAIIWS